MKILWLSHLVPYPPKGGVLQRSYNLIREICKYNDLTLIAFIQPNLIKSRLSKMDTGLVEAHECLSKFCDHVEFIEIPCERSSYGKYLLALKSLLTIDPYTINWLKSDVMKESIKRINNITAFDLVHFDTISLGSYIDEFTNIPKVLDHHNIESHMMLRRAVKEKNPFKHLYYYQEGKKLQYYEKKICHQFDLHLTCSPVDSNNLIKIDSSLAITEILNGVDINYFYPQLKNEMSKHLIFAGALNWYPNRDAMIYFADKIWPLLKKKIPDITMNVVGSSPPQKLLNLANEDDHFKIHGFVDDVREYISRATVYVCPIRDGGGTKLKILDAFSMGIATVAHPIACEGIDVCNGENVLLASSAEQFVSKIELLFTDTDRRRRIALNARALVERKYDFSQIGKKLSNCYQQLIN